MRGYANLGNAMVEYGDLERAFEVYQQGRDAAQRFGDVDRILWFEVERMYECYWRGLLGRGAAAGRRDRVADRRRLALGRRSTTRGWCGRGSGWGDGQEPQALEDSSRALELGRHAGYPEMLVPSLALQARVLEAAGRSEEAAAAGGRAAGGVAAALPDLLLGV